MYYPTKYIDMKISIVDIFSKKHLQKDIWLVD